MSSQFQQAESLLEKIQNLKVWGKKSGYEKLGKVENDQENSQANDNHFLRAGSAALKNKPSSKQVRLDMKALNDCQKNVGKLDDVKNDLISILANYKDLATTLGNRDGFNTYLSNLKGIIGQKERDHKYMAYDENLYRDEDHFKDEKEGTLYSIQSNKVGILLYLSFGAFLSHGIIFAIQAKLKLLKQLMDNHGYQAFMSTYEICTERLAEFEGKNAIEAKRICGNYLYTIKKTFKAVGIDLDIIKKEANAKQKDRQQKYMKILENCQKLAKDGQLEQIEKAMRELRKSHGLLFSTLKAFNQALQEWNERKIHLKDAEQSTYGVCGERLLYAVRKKLNILVMIMNDIYNYLWAF
jgi:hypothetical protein